MNRFVFGERAPVEHVNFESKTKLPPVDGLKECRGSIVPGIMNVWYEYIPDVYKRQPFMIRFPILRRGHSRPKFYAGRARYSGLKSPNDR